MSTPRTWGAIPSDHYAKHFFDVVVSRAKELGYLKEENLVFGPFKIPSKTKCHGECVSTVKPSKTGFYSSVGINERVLVSEDATKHVIVHEVAHACCPRDGHGSLWKDIGNNIGAKFGVYVSRLNDYSSYGVESWDEESLTKYTIACPKCGAEWHYCRMTQAVKHPEEYTCRKCLCDLVRTK